MLVGCFWSVSTWELFGTYVLIAGINEGHFKKEGKGIQIQNLVLDVKI